MLTGRLKRIRSHLYQGSFDNQATETVTNQNDRPALAPRLASHGTKFGDKVTCEISDDTSRLAMGYL